MNECLLSLAAFPLCARLVFFLMLCPSETHTLQIYTNTYDIYTVLYKKLLLSQFLSLSSHIVKTNEFEIHSNSN